MEGAPDWPDSDLEAWMPPGEVSWAAPALPRGGAQPSSGPRCSLHPGASRRRAPSLPHSAGPAPGGFAGQAAEGCSRQRASVGTLPVHFLHRPPPCSFCLSGRGRRRGAGGGVAGNTSSSATVAGRFLFARLATRGHAPPGDFPRARPPHPTPAACFRRFICQRGFEGRVGPLSPGQGPALQLGLCNLTL